MSPESTVAYYEYITRTYTERHGGYGYPEILFYRVSSQPDVDWPEEDCMAASMLSLRDAGHAQAALRYACGKE
jgi:aspartate racemase